jgi:hypothetical protein
MGWSPEQRAIYVAVTKSFQARRKVLLEQRQGIYGLLQRPLTRYNNAEDTIAEFLKVQAPFQLPLKLICIPMMTLLQHSHMYCTNIESVEAGGCGLPCLKITQLVYRGC